MHMTAIEIEEALPFDLVEEAGAAVMRGLAIGAAMSLPIWLLPLAAWFLLA